MALRWPKSRGSVHAAHAPQMSQVSMWYVAADPHTALDVPRPYFSPQVWQIQVGYSLGALGS